MRSLDSLSTTEILRLTELSRETLRHWQQVVPHLAAKKGRKPSFTRGDALGLLIMRTLVKDLGVAVGGYRVALQELFEGLNAHYPPSHPGVFCFIEPKKYMVVNLEELPSKLARFGHGITILVAPLESQLVAQMAVLAQGGQGELALDEDG